jgi:IMP dehydrogenase
MASKEAQVDWRGYPSSIEGVSTTVPLKGPVGAILHELEIGIRSGLSYSGARTVRELQAKAQFMKQSYSGTSEGSTHILNGS